MFGKDIEGLKKAFHQALVFNDWSLIRQIKELDEFDVPQRLKEMDYKVYSGKRIEFMGLYKKHIKDRFELQQLQQLERLERLQQLQQLEQLERLERLELFSLDWLECYNNISKNILENSIIYCDPPYEVTGTYQAGKGFDYVKFWQWFRECPYSVYVSSYKAPDDIQPLKSVEKTVTLNSGSKKNGIKMKRKKVAENIYWNGKGKPQLTFEDLLFSN
jgi:site-specific DNA-adenine methylase